jgi:hypothetical protein
MDWKNKNLFGIAAVVVVTSISLFVSSTPAFAATTSFGKWSSRTQTMYISTGADISAWQSGASKWKNATNYNISTAIGVNSTYYTVDVNNSKVDWDGLTTYNVLNGKITQATLNLNTYYTAQSKYTSSIKAGVTGHEVGHSLGLNHTSVVETSSIMHPYTFNSNGTLARSLSPSSSDISVVNGLYPALLKNEQTDPSESELTTDPNIVYMHPSWAVYYANEQELREAADLVVYAKVSDRNMTPFQINDISTYVTETNVDILDVVKGDLAQPGDRVVVSQMGGTFGNMKAISDSSTLLQHEQVVLLFLRQVDENTYRPINGDDGVYVSTGGSFHNISSQQALNESLLP